jgi:threonine dehydrogenase-like Zn-dependent dehydrogenase
MAEYITVEEKYCIPFKDDLSFNEASMTEPRAVAYRAAHKISDDEISRAKYCMVVGAGAIGLLIISLL